MGHFLNVHEGKLACALLSFEQMHGWVVILIDVNAYAGPQGIGTRIGKFGWQRSVWVLIGRLFLYSAQ